MKMFRCDICGSRLNNQDDCFVSISAFSKRVDDHWDSKKLKVSEKYELCPDCWSEVDKAIGETLEKLVDVS